VREGSDEARIIDFHYAVDEYQITQSQTYVRTGRHVGAITCTALDEQLRELSPWFDRIMKSARFRPAEESDAAGSAQASRP
jgi:hypothetical protein